jgi:guanylate kinase
MTTEVKQSGRLIVVAAASGAGKTSLVSALIHAMPSVEVAISHTTRPRRSNEQHGEDYFFVSEDEFHDMQQADKFIESALVFDNLYGTSRMEMDRILARGRHLILEIDWQGAQQIRNSVSAAELVYIMPPSLHALRERLLTRAQDDITTVDQRMALAVDEMSHYDEFDYLVINDDFDQALADLRAIVDNRGEALTLRNQTQRHQDLVNELTTASR